MQRGPKNVKQKILLPFFITFRKQKEFSLVPQRIFVWYLQGGQKLRLTTIPLGDQRIFVILLNFPLGSKEIFVLAYFLCGTYFGPL
jgi:hypothetical protein